MTYHFDIYKNMKSEDAVKALSALAQDSRLEVFRLLVRAGEEGMQAGAIAAELEIPPATLTFHLKELVHAGLIDRRRESRCIIYTLRIAGMRDLICYLTNDCCQGRPELCQPDYSDKDGCDTTCKPSKKARAKSKVKSGK